MDTPLNVIFAPCFTPLNVIFLGRYADNCYVVRR